MLETYSEFQEEIASEKTVLVKIRAAKRLMGWALDSGFIYKITGFDISVVESIEQNGVDLIESASLAGMVQGSWYNDRDAKELYLWASDDSNPNSKFIGCKFWNFWASTPVTLPFDLSTGKEIEWLPIVKNTSLFGVELDNEEQLGFAIEGSGTITIINDQEYWIERWDKLLWEFQPVYIWSYNRELPATEAKLIYRGKVSGKTYTSKTVNFKLKDTLQELRREITLANLSELSGALIPDGLLEAKQRRIYGKVYGYRPTNIDQALDGYLLPGTVTGSPGVATVTGSGTSFLSHFSPDDEIIIGEDSYTVKSVASDTSLTLTDEVGVGFTAAAYSILPALPKTFINRTWLLAGHECRQPETTVTNVVAINKFYVANLTDLDVGDDIFVGSPGAGEVLTIIQINSDGLIKTAQSATIALGFGTPVTRFCAQNVRINKRKLVYDRDYTIDFTGGVTRLILDAEAEKNVNPRASIIGSVTFSNGSRTVTGSGTFFTSQVQPNQYIRSALQFDEFEILSVDSDTQLTLRSAATYSQTGDAVIARGTAFDAENDFLTCEIIGTTSTNLKSGTLLRTASDIVKDILTKAGITGLNAPAFAKSKEVQPAFIGLALPETFEGTKAPTARDIINKINFSVFGSLVQNEDFELEYNILRPNKPSFITLREDDILSWSVEGSNERVVKTAQVQWRRKEYDYESGLTSFSLATKTSDVGQYLIESQNTKTIDTLLIDETNAQYHANRWAFLLEQSTSVVKVKTKLKAFRAQVNDIIMIEHEKLFDRVGGGQRKFGAIQAIRKNGGTVELEIDDLGNAFNRVAIITENDAPIFNESNEVLKAKNGFITDQYGLINNDSETFGLNLIW